MIAPLGLLFACLALFITAVVQHSSYSQKSQSLGRKRDQYLDKMLTEALAAGQNASTILRRKFSEPNFRLIISKIAPTGFKTAMRFFGLAACISLIFLVLELGFQVETPLSWMVLIVMPFIGYGVFKFYDDSVFYSKLAEMTDGSED